jgi:hypothetical protein
MKLTKKAINSLKYQGEGQSQDIRWDDQIPGFGIRIYPTERKSFVLSYRSNGRKHIMSVGSYGVLTLEQARKKAKSLLGQVVDGKDPMQDRVTARRGQKFRQLAEIYMERHARVYKKTWKTDQNRLDKYLIPEFGGLSIKAITRNDIGALHQKIGKSKPYEANRNLALITVIFNCAKEWGFLVGP